MDDFLMIKKRESDLRIEANVAVFLEISARKQLLKRKESEYQYKQLRLKKRIAKWENYKREDKKNKDKIGVMQCNDMLKILKNRLNKSGN